MKRIIIGLLLLSVFHLEGQQLISLNTRLEFLSAVSNCAGSPDQCPRWGTTIAPFSGNHFLGIHEFNYTNSGEAISARLSAPLVAGTAYTYTVMAAIAPITAWGGSGNGDRNGVIYVYGGTAACATTQLIDSITLFTPADRNNWRQFTFNFTASANHTHLSFLTRKVTSGGYAALSYMVLDDAIRFDFGDAPDTYKTLLASNGARHQLIGTVSSPVIGYTVDGEEDGFPGTSLTGDDNSGPVDDEDGFTALPDLTLSQTLYSLNNILVKNSTGKMAYLAGWIDFNKNGIFENTEAAVTPVPSTGALNVNLNWSGFTVPFSGTSYARFRISTDSTIVNPVASLCKAIGLAADGEVEDYKINFSSCTPVNVSPDVSVCSGESVRLQATGAANYTWSPSLGLSCPNCDTTTAAPAVTTTYVVTGSSGNGCVSTDTVTVTVDEKVIITVLPEQAAICEGESLPLTVSGATDVSWTPVTGLSCSNCLTPMASPTVTTTYRVSAATSACSFLDSAVIIVHPKPQKPFITADRDIFCANDSAKLCAPSGFVSYLWNTGGQQSCEWTRFAGNYYLTVTDANGCTAESNRKAVNVYPVPSVSIIVQGDTLSSFGAVSYQWIRNGVDIPGATSAVYIVSQSGLYSLRITDANGCESTSKQVEMIMSGIPDLLWNEVSLLPNPLSGNQLMVKIPSLMKGIQISIFDNNGRLIHESFLDDELSEIPFDAARGVYFVHFTNQDFRFAMKLVKW